MHALLHAPQLWALVAGFVLPGLTAVVQQPRWKRNQRRLIAVVASTIAGTLTVLVADQVDPGDWITTVVALATASEVAYKKLWKPFGVAGKIEQATSPAGDNEAAYQTEVPDTEDPGPAE